MAIGPQEQQLFDDVRRQIRDPELPLHLKREWMLKQVGRAWMKRRWPMPEDNWSWWRRWLPDLAGLAVVTAGATLLTLFVKIVLQPWLKLD